MAAGNGYDLFSTRTREALRARKATENPLGRPKRPGKSELVIRFVRRSRRCSRPGRSRSLSTRQLRKLNERAWNQEARDTRILWRIRYLCWVRAKNLTVTDCQRLAPKPALMSSRWTTPPMPSCDGPKNAPVTNPSSPPAWANVLPRTEIR